MLFIMTAIAFYSTHPLLDPFPKTWHSDCYANMLGTNQPNQIYSQCPNTEQTLLAAHSRIPLSHTCISNHISHDLMAEICDSVLPSYNNIAH